MERRILITGATSGIGRALALALAAEGTHLVLTGRRPDALQNMAAGVAQKGGTVATHILELSCEADVFAFGHAAAKQYPKLERVIQSAAVIKLGSIEGSDIADLDWHYRVNLKAPVILTQCLMTPVRRARGQFVFINSAAGLNASHGFAFYSACKHGLKAIADSLRQEVAAAGITVLSVFPGRVNTPMQERVLKMEGTSANLNSYLQPNEVAQAIISAMDRCRRREIENLALRAGEEPRWW